MCAYVPAAPNLQVTPLARGQSLNLAPGAALHQIATRYNDAALARVEQR
jgi:hypothetical protein